VNQTTAPRPAAKRRGFAFQIVAAIAVGLALGLLARATGAHPGDKSHPLAMALSLVGSSFITLLRATVAPLVFAAIVASVARLGELNNAARLAAQTFLWFAITALIAVSIGIILGLTLQPGLHSGAIAADAAQPHTVGSWLDFIKGLIPVNMLGLAASTKLDGTSASTAVDFNILQVVVIALAVGSAALHSGEAGQRFLGWTSDLLVVLRKLLGWVIRLAPIGTAALIGNAVVQYGWDTLSRLGLFAGALYLGLALVVGVVYPTLLAAHGLSPRRFFARAWPAMQLAFVSRSSAAALPLAEVAAEELGVPRAYASFAVPIASTTKMDGCAAVYPAVAAIFIAQFYGITLAPLQYGLIVAVSVLGSAATAGVTGAVVMLTLTLSTLGLPLEGVGLLLAIDPILDMGRTAVNVTGQILIPTIVARREGLLDEARYNAGHSEDALIA
jgi:Na+/H+-dicarboxylate symporter